MRVRGTMLLNAGGKNGEMFDSGALLRTATLSRVLRDFPPPDCYTQGFYKQILELVAICKGFKAYA